MSDALLSFATNISEIVFSHFYVYEKFRQVSVINDLVVPFNIHLLLDYIPLQVFKLTSFRFILCFVKIQESNKLLIKGQGEEQKRVDEKIKQTKGNIESLVMYYYCRFYQFFFFLIFIFSPTYRTLIAIMKSLQKSVPPFEDSVEFFKRRDKNIDQKEFSSNIIFAQTHFRNKHNEAWNIRKQSLREDSLRSHN